MKQYEALYIDGQQVNIGTSDITLEWKSVILSNISKLKVSHSYTIKLPMTANNRQIFDSSESAEHTAYVFANGKKTPIGKRLSARYYCNGIDMLGAANAYLIGTENGYYRVALTWGALTQLETLADDDRTLPEIFGGTNAPRTVDYYRWQSSEINSSLGKDIACLRYANGVVGDTFYNYIWYLPSFKVTYLLKRIFDKYGIAFDLKGADGKVDSLLDSLYCPMTTMNDSEYMQNLYSFRFSITDNKDYLIKCSDSVWLTTNTAPSVWGRCGYITIDSGRKVSGWVGLHQNMKYKVKTHIRAFFKQQDIINKFGAGIDDTRKGEAQVVANVKLAICNGSQKDDASKILSLTPNHVSSEWRDNNSNVYIEARWEYASWEEVDANDTPGHDRWKEVSWGDESKMDDVLCYRQGRRVLIDGVDFAILAPNGFASEALTSNVTGQRCGSYSNYVDVRPIVTELYPWIDDFDDTNSAWYTAYQTKSTICFEPNYPEIKPMDFLKGIFYIIGAYPYIKNNTLHITLYKELVDNWTKAVDWSGFLIGDYEASTSVDFSIDDWNRKNWMWWKEDDEGNPKYSGFFEIDDQHLKSEDDVFTLPFIGCDTDREMSKLPLYESGKVLNYMIYKGTVWFGAKVSKADEVDGYVFKGCKPVVGVRHSNKAIGQSISTSEATALDYLSFDELSFKSAGGLMDTRYKIFAELLKHPYVLTGTFELDEYTLAELDMSVPVYLRQYGSYFGIMSIKRKSDGRCTIKLLRIPDTLITGE